MKSQIVQFFYQKTNGEIRQAFGTMQDEVIHDKVKAMPESEVCKLYNADSKSEIIALIYEEITALESYQGEDCSEDDGMDYIGLQLSQGMAVIRW